MKVDTSSFASYLNAKHLSIYRILASIHYSHSLNDDKVTYICQKCYYTLNIIHWAFNALCMTWYLQNLWI